MSPSSPALQLPFELARNRVFLDLQSRLGNTLRVTQQADGGTAALQRFDAVPTRAPATKEPTVEPGQRRTEACT